MSPRTRGGSSKGRHKPAKRVTAKRAQKRINDKQRRSRRAGSNYDHQAEFDVEIMRQLKEVEAYAEAAKDSPGRRRLRERSLRP